MNSFRKIVHIIGRLGWFDHADQLRSLVRRHLAADMRVTVIPLAGTRRETAEFTEQGADCFIIHRRWGHDISAAHQLTRLLKQLRPEVVHFWGNGAAEFAAAVRWSVPQAFLIATIASPLRDLFFWSYSNHVSLNSVVTDVPVGDSFSHCFVAPGVACELAPEQSREELISRMQLPPDALLVCTAGPFERSARIKEALWNFELVRTIQDRACLLIVGTGPEQWRLERYARMVSEPQAIRFVDPADWHPATIGHCNVYWQPGDSHQIPTALLQAMACGVPVVANEVPAHEAVIRHGENGLLLPTAKRALWTRHTGDLFTNPQQRECLTSAARRTIEEQFSETEMAAAYARLYVQVDGPRPG